MNMEKCRGSADDIDLLFNKNLEHTAYCIHACFTKIYLINFTFRTPMCGPATFEAVGGQVTKSLDISRGYESRCVSAAHTTEHRAPPSSSSAVL